MTNKKFNQGKVIETSSLFKYLFIYLFLAESGLSCSTRALSLRCVGSVVAALGLSSCGMWA